MKNGGSDEKKRTASNDLNEISKASKLSKTSKTARESSSKKRSKQPGHSYNQKATHNAAQGQVDRLTGMFIKVHEIIPADKLIDIFQESLNQVLIERKDGGNVVLQNNLALVENSNVSTALFNGLQLEKKEEEKLFSTLRSRIELFLLHNFQSNPELVRQLKQEILNSGGIREELKFVNTEIDEDVEHPNSYELGRGETTEILPDPIDLKRGREYVDGNSNGSVGIVSEMIQVAESTAFRKTNESVAKKTPVVEKNSKITITPEPTPVWRRDVIVDGEAGKVGTGVQLLPRPASLQFDKDAANFNRNSSFYTSEGDNQKKVSVSERWISSHRLKKLKQSHGITYSSGKFTDEEDSIISEAIARVCAQKNWTKDSLLQFLFQKNPNDQEEYNGVWRQICGSITNRPLQAIYHHIKRIYNPKNYKGNWSEAEDNQLFFWYERLGPRWEVIGRRMGRTGTNCRDRWRYIKPNKSTRQTGPWTKEETRLLIDSIYKLRKKADIQPYKVVYGAKISVSWEQIASLVQTRNAAQCRGKWNGFNTKHDNDIELAAQWTPSMDLLLIRAIKNAYLTHNARIPWKKVVAELSSSNVAANCHTARERWDHLKRSVLGYKTMKPVDVADFLETKLATN